MAISKRVREAAYQKYGGRCAYCGRKIAYKDMQVDHFIPKNGYFAQGTDELSNLMPACRMCNHYKRANSLELFRTYIREIPRKLRGNYIYKVGVAYGNIIENEKPIVFYFEEQEAKKNCTVPDIENAPTVDAVVVTRCKDCAYWKKTDQKQGPSVEHMEYIGSCVISRFYKKENDFCSDGEPKDEYHADDHD